MTEEQISQIMVLVDKYAAEAARVEYFTQCDQLSGEHEADKQGARDAVLAALATQKD